MSGRTVVPVEARWVKDPEGGDGILLQLPDGYVILLPEGARQVARMLLELADERVELQP